MEIEDGVVQTTRSKLNDIAFIVGIVVYCVLGTLTPVIGIIHAVKLLNNGAEVINIVMNPIAVGLVATAVNFPVGFCLLSYPIANFRVFGSLKIAKDPSEAQVMKFDKYLNIMLAILICFMLVAVLCAIYALINVQTIPLTSAIIFIILEGLGLISFISGAISQFFYG